MKADLHYVDWNSLEDNVLLTVSADCENQGEGKTSTKQKSIDPAPSNAHRATTTLINNDYDWERRHKDWTCSRSRRKSTDRKLSRSKSCDYNSKHANELDMAHPAETSLLGIPLLGQLTRVTPALPCDLPRFLGNPFAALSGIPLLVMTQQAMKYSRCGYVGVLSPVANKHTIAAYFSQAMQVIGGNSAPGDIVVKIYIKHEQKFVFVEMWTMGDTSNRMALDNGLTPAAPLLNTFRLDYYTNFNMMFRAEGQFDAEHVIKHSFHQFQHNKALTEGEEKVSALEHEVAIYDAIGEHSIVKYHRLRLFNIRHGTYNWGWRIVVHAVKKQAAE